VILDYLHQTALSLNAADRAAVAALSAPLACCERASVRLKEAIRSRDENAVFLPLFSRGQPIAANIDRLIGEGRTIVAEAFEFDSFFINQTDALPPTQRLIVRADIALEGDRAIQNAAAEFFAQAAIAPYLQTQATLPNSLLIRIHGIIARALVQALRIDGVSITNGEGCSLDLFVPSFVVQSYGFSEDEARQAISLSWKADAELAAVMGALDRLLFRSRQIRAMGD
jgi:hypothetical protein